MSDDRPEIVPFGDAALLASFPERIDPEINRRVHLLAGRIREARRSGAAFGEPVPAYASLLAPYDPLRFRSAQAMAVLTGLVEEHDAPEETAAEALPLLEIPVRYGGDLGPDLDDVARQTGMSPVEVIRRHSERVYRAYFLGFAPGFAYLGTLAAELQVPRRATPRQRVPAGSVAIAGEQTAVYPLATPGGWHLLGHTELRLWDERREPPALIRPGQEVRFVALPD